MDGAIVDRLWWVEHKLLRLANLAFAFALIVWGLSCRGGFARCCVGTWA